MENYTIYRTAESVSPGHPDKLCDQISDAILDAYLAQDPAARVAVEVCGGHGQIFIVGEVTSSVSIPDSDLIKIARDRAGKNMRITINLVKQSPEIAQGVDVGGAGDQGIMIGYACDETSELLPLEVILARRLNQHIYAQHPFDGKTQVTLLRPNSGQIIPNSSATAPNPSQTPSKSESPIPNSDSQNPKNPQSPIFVNSIVASFQNVTRAELQTLIQEFIEQQHLLPVPGHSATELHLNPAGDWHQGGFEADTGLTGRKLIVDNYGPRIPIGGGAFSGKDPSKVDRSAAYMARRIAVDYLRARQAHEVFVRLAYAIGHANPLESTVIINGQPEQITGYDLTPQGIINHLDLKRPIYEPTARYGHFGEGFDWDR